MPALGNLIHGTVPAVILNFLFVLANLLFHLVESMLEAIGNFGRESLIMSHEIVLMFRIHQNLDPDPIINVIQRDLNCSHAFKVVEELLGLSLDEVMELLAD